MRKKTTQPTTCERQEVKNSRNIFVVLSLMLLLGFVWFCVWFYDWIEENILGVSSAGKDKNVAGSTGYTDDKILMLQPKNTINKITNTTGGASGGGSRYVHDQNVAASTWTINHELCAKPIINVYTTSGEILGFDTRQDNYEVRYNPETNEPYNCYHQTILTFSNAISGFAYLAS